MKWNIAGDQGLFMILTLIVMVIILIISKDIMKSILIIGLLTNFLIISTYLTTIKQRRSEESSGATSRLYEDGFDGDLVAAAGSSCGPVESHEGYWPSPGAPPPEPLGYETWNSESIPPPATAYEGAIDADFGPGEDYPGWNLSQDSEDTAPYGHHDRTAFETDSAPIGNPFDLDRIGSPAAAGPCLDDESQGGNFDADELNAYHARSRNDETRVVAGSMRRKEFMDRFVREELEEEEDSMWWGRGEW